MKNWRFVQTGNYDAQKELGLSPVHEGADKEVAEIITKYKGDKEKARIELLKKHNLSEQQVKHILDKYFVGNESIDKQEWSMFKGLGKDAEKEIGNVLPPSGLYAKLLDEICEKEGIDSNKAREKYGQYSIEQWEKLLGRKIGNARHSKEQLLADVRELKKYIEQHKGEDCEKEKRLLGEAMEELDKYYGVIVPNSKTGNSENIQKIHEILEDLISGKVGYLQATKMLESAGARPEDAKTYAQHPKDYAKHMIERRDWGNAYKRDEGNGELRNEYNAEIYRLEKKMEELYRRGQGHSAMQIQKQIEQLQRELREIDNKKVDNKDFRFLKKEDLQNVSYTVRSSKTPAKTFKSRQDAKRYVDELVGKGEFGVHTQKNFTVDSMDYSIDINPNAPESVMNNLKRARNSMNKKVGNLDHVEEGDYVEVRYQGEIVEGVVRKIQGTQALVTIDGTDMWFPIRSLKESI